ncbi:MAG: glutathione peroxidase [Pseudomonadota bacterium]|nr:glutathione peroxidase [Pseudomonadota bacterium]
MEIYDIPLQRLDGTPDHLARYRRQVLLVVNVASACGFTPQYAGLQKLHARYHARGFSVLGFPCNQFGQQEPGAADAIAAFCTSRFAVTFPLFAKTEVNGTSAHPLWRQLKKEAPGILGTEAIKWNFTKFLVDAGGKVVARYAPTDTPERIARDIEALLGSDA